jgi:Holliday junction DNA helicase RuvA
VVEVSPASGEVVIDVGGVGLGVKVTRSAADSLIGECPSGTIHTHLAVYEGGLDLYGFLDRQERDAFELLLTVSGMGPKGALKILSDVSYTTLLVYIGSGDAASLVKVKGIGKATAERLVMELRKKCAPAAPVLPLVTGGKDTAYNQRVSDVRSALLNLGHKAKDIAGVMAAVEEKAVDPEVSVEDLVLLALKNARKAR